jgi:hypothetical protein
METEKFVLTPPIRIGNLEHPFEPDALDRTFIRKPGVLVILNKPTTNVVLVELIRPDISAIRRLLNLAHPVS